MTKRERQIIVAQINVDAHAYAECKTSGQYDKAKFFLDRLSRLLYVAACLGLDLEQVETYDDLYYVERGA